MEFKDSSHIPHSGFHHPWVYPLYGWLRQRIVLVSIGCWHNWGIDYVGSGDICFSAVVGGEERS